MRLRLIRRRIRPDGSLGQRSLGWNAPHEAVGEAAREVFEVLRGLPVASGPYAGTSSSSEARAATSAGAAMAVAPGLHGHILLRAARSGRLVHPGSVPARPSRALRYASTRPRARRAGSAPGRRTGSTTCR